MYRERSNLTLKREQSMLAEMGGQNDPNINVAIPDAGADDGSYESMMAEADGQYAVADYEGALLLYSMAMAAYPNRTEILDGLTRAQAGLEEKLANPDRQPTSGNLRVSEGIASNPGAGRNAPVRFGAPAHAPVHASQQSSYEDPRKHSRTPAGAAAVPPPKSRAGVGNVPPPSAWAGDAAVPPPKSRAGVGNVPPPSAWAGDAAVPPPKSRAGVGNVPPPSAWAGDAAVPPPKSRAGVGNVPPPSAWAGDAAVPPPKSRAGVGNVPQPSAWAGNAAVPPPKLQAGVANVPPSSAWAGVAAVPTPMSRSGVAAVPPPMSRSGVAAVPPPMSQAVASPYPTPAPRATASSMNAGLYSPMIAPTPGYPEASSRASSMSLPPQSAMGAATPGPTALSPALVMAVDAAPSRAGSQARRPSSGRLSNRPPSASRVMTARPVTPAGPADIRDPSLYIGSQLSKINEDIGQELWERCQDRCEQLIDTIRKVPKDKMDTEEKETHLATVYNSLGKADFAMGNMDKALEDHNLAIHIAETYGLFDVKTVADAAIGRIQMSLGRESSTMWEETIRTDKLVAPKPVAPPPVPGNLVRTKTILATEDSPAMVDIAMPAFVRTHTETTDLKSMIAEAQAKTSMGDHEGALMLYSAAQTQYPDRREVEQGLKAAEAALQKSMEGVMTSRADKKVHFNKGWATDDIEDAAVYLDPEQEAMSLRKYATEMQDQIEEDLKEGDLETAQEACEEFMEKFATMEDDVTLAERFGFLATAHNQLGRALGAQGLMDRALDEHTAALQIAERNGLDDVKFEALDLIARLDLSQGNVEKAISTWKECLAVCLDQSEKSEIYHKIALAELTQDNYMQARINGDKAAMAAIKAGDTQLQFNAHLVIGMTLVKSGDRIGALDEYRKALKLAVARDDADQQEDIQRRMDALESGDFDEAAAVPMEAIDAVMVVATPISSRDASRNASREASRNASRVASRNASREASRASSRRQTPTVSRNQSQATTPVHSRRSSRAPSPTRITVSYEDETEILSPRGIDLGAMKSPRPRMSAGPAVIDDTLLMIQMYLLYTLPEF